MPAKWDNQKMAKGGAVAAATGQPASKLVPPPTLKQRAFRSQPATLQRQQTRYHHRNDSSNQTFDDIDERSYWQHDFDTRLNGLGIQSSPSRYEIRRGKAVPLPSSSQQRQLSPPPDSDEQVAPPVHHPPARNPLRLNPHHWRPTSSVYVQEDEEEHRDSHSAPSKSKKPAKDMYHRPTGLNISPPSSPELGAAHYGAYPDDVSPIDDDADVSQQELLHSSQMTPPPHHEAQSHIPTMRRERRPEHNRAASNLRESRSHDRLRDPQGEAYHPWETGPSQTDASLTSRQGFGLTTTVTGPQVHRSGNPGPSLGQRMRQLARGKTEPIESRPPWKGASGRAPMVDPVQDDLGVAPLAVQRKNSKRGLRAGRVSPETSNTTAATVRRLLPSRSNQKLKESSKTPSPEPASHEPAHAYPSPPYDDAPVWESQAPVPPPQTSQRVPLHPRHLPDPNKAIRRKPSPSTFVPTHIPQNSTSSSQYSAYTDQSVSTYVPHLSAASPLSLFGGSDEPWVKTEPWVQPPSRFSVTTCNTVIPDSPRPEEEQPPVPPMPEQLPSVMDRRRPVFGGERTKTPPVNDPIIISMKTSVAASPKPETTESSTDRPSSLVSTSKALPPVPPEKMTAGDRVAYLNARLDSLAHRRLNINKSIKQMTELMPTGSLMSSAEVLRKRETEKKKVEGLKEELAEIQREEYDLGLKLYRANKRLERESGYEGSTLWVRRATSA
ncbi:hypothetical protein B0T10DRAFT_454032 [Thelonectria olida]|uniref:Uncharacterized protein n=1 Tax=Thelonectria olida TaxID=1576542 RepID=A0A9P9AWI2_9HYPO|nr:hypothetical protein B0T10DRAFT_454032 [Thelonectria olida]